MRDLRFRATVTAALAAAVVLIAGGVWMRHVIYDQRTRLSEADARLAGINVDPVTIEVQIKEILGHYIRVEPCHCMDGVPAEASASCSGPGDHVSLTL